MTAKKTTVKTTPDPSVAWAEKLWDRLASSMLDAQNTIVAIIEAKAWEPLGYESFEKAWVDKMSGFTISVEVQPTVVYQLLSEGLSVDQVAAAVKGVGTEIAETLKRQRDNGVPAELASRRSKRNGGTPRPRTTIFVHVGEVKLAEYEALAEARGIKVEDVSRDAIAAAFREMA